MISFYESRRKQKEKKRKRKKINGE